MDEFLIGAKEWLAHSYGYFALAAVILILAWLITRKGFLWIFFFLVVGAPLILWLAPISGTKGAVAGIKGSQNVMCTEFGGAYCDPSWTTSSSSSGSSDSGGSGSGGSSDYGGVSSQPVITGTLKANATAILMSKIAQTYGLTPSNRIPVSAANLPAGVSLDLVCTKNATEENEVWTVGLRDEINGGTYTTEVNGSFARSWDLKGASCANKDTATIRGTGNWYALCRECYESVTVTTQTPSPQDPQVPPPQDPQVTPPSAGQFTGCSSRYIAGGVHAGFQNRGNTSVYCLNGDWVTMDEFLKTTGGLTPAQVLAMP